MPAASAGPWALDRRTLLSGLAVTGLAATLPGCQTVGESLGAIKRVVSGGGEVPKGPDVDAFLDDVQRRTFNYFWETTELNRGLAPDRFPTPSFASIAAMGFALTGFVIGVERGYAPRAEAAKRTLAMLKFLSAAPQGPEPDDRVGYYGFFYHFLDTRDGMRFEKCEVSTVDTALLMMGVLLAMTYYDRPEEAEIRKLADDLYRKVDWRWAMTRGSVISMGWTPEAGFIAYDWEAYNEGMLVYILGLGAPVYALEPASWTAWSARLATYWTDSGDLSQLRFGPLFGHQYSHVWIDFREIQDAFMRTKGIDYFENSRRATAQHRNYAMANPDGWRGYGANQWGLTACDGPTDIELEVDGARRRFRSYSARGVGDFDDGTIAPTAAGGSMPFAPEICLPALMAMKARHGNDLYGAYGFLDAFNETFVSEIRLKHGRVVPDKGWYDDDYIGIDQGPILAMIENHRTGLIWEIMRRNPYIRAGLDRAGFTGGWLKTAPPAAPVAA